MLDFVRKAFRGGLTVILWINLIFCLIAGGILGASSEHIFVGILIGFVAGVLINIVMGGFIATILNMDKNLELLVTGYKDPIKDELLSPASESYVDIPHLQVSQACVVISSTKLKKNPYGKSDIIRVLNVGDIIYYQNGIKNVKEDKKYYYIRTSDSCEGWCVADDLKVK